MNFLANKELFVALNNKAEEIQALPLSGLLSDLDGLEIAEDGVTIKTHQYYSRGGEDYQSAFFTWEELDKPIEYFKDLFQENHDRKIREQAEREAKTIEHNKQMEIMRLKQLKEKYPNE